jgi:hypothetical protein
MNKEERNNQLPDRWFKINPSLLDETVISQYLLFTGRTDGIHTLAFLKKQRERI